MTENSIHPVETPGDISICSARFAYFSFGKLYIYWPCWINSDFEINVGKPDDSEHLKMIIKGYKNVGYNIETMKQSVHGLRLLIPR